MAVQPEIPHIEEHVSKVECVGLQTQQKLLDIKAAATTVGIHNLSVVHNSVTTGAVALQWSSAAGLQGSRARQSVETAWNTGASEV